MSASPILYPPRLREGAVLGLVAPASPPADAAKIPEAIGRLRAQGFQVKVGKHLEKRDGYLAGSDQERADDLNAFFADPGVEGIFALRGGYGSCRILPRVDYAMIRKNPKPLIGYSDITALHQAIFKESGLVTFHGPNASEAFLPGNAARLRRMLLGPGEAGGTTLFSREEYPAVKTVTPGRARGRLIGGNLTCLERLIGTPYGPDFRGVILFLEDIGEKAYRLDGMLTHLRLAGVLTQIGGLVLGRFDHEDDSERSRIAACLQREAERLAVPCVSGAPIGHFPEQIILPHGIEADLDADEGRLSCSLSG